MSAQAIFTLGAASEAASRAIAKVSPKSGNTAIGPALPDDIGNLFLWLNDAQAAQADAPYQPVDPLAFKDWLDRHTKTVPALFVIRSLQPARAVGFVLFKNLNPAFRAAELGVRIGAEADRGKGFGSSAIALALDYAWNSLNLHRVWLTVFAGNDRAIAAYARAGFREEGLMRQAAFSGGQWHDVMMMAALNPSESA
jgi:RimJ/RimL family protein N-acetyltransferase